MKLFSSNINIFSCYGIFVLKCLTKCGGDAKTSDMNASASIAHAPETASNPTGASPNPSSAAPVPEMMKVKHLSRVLNGIARWRILRELAKGEALPVKELALRAGCPAASASKHMLVLKKAGVVTVGYGRLYKLSPHLQPEPGCLRLDLGHCIIKLDTKW
jgi:DNA-binding transcriptional ArsR family regulator